MYRVTKLHELQVTYPQYYVRKEKRQVKEDPSEKTYLKKVNLQILIIIFFIQLTRINRLNW